jgi:hypothetical protein
MRSRLPSLRTRKPTTTRTAKPRRRTRTPERTANFDEELDDYVIGGGKAPSVDK